MLPWCSLCVSGEACASVVKLVRSVRSQFVRKSVRYFGQLVLIFRSIRTRQYFLWSVRPHLANSYSSWSVRTRFGQFVLTLNSNNFEGKKEGKEERKKEKLPTMPKSMARHRKSPRCLQTKMGYSRTCVREPPSRLTLNSD